MPELASSPQQRNFQRFAWGVLGYTLLVVFWGAFVRASLSGNGCGAHWPSCGGQVLPDTSRFKTLVEFSHRISSSILLPPVLVALVGWTYWAQPKGHPARKSAFVALMFIAVEALIGAYLVLNGLVARHDSAARAVAMPLHLISSFILLGSLALTAWWGSGAPRPQWRGQGPVLFLLVGSLGLMIWLSCTGALAALGDTIYPATSHLQVMHVAALRNATLVMAQRPRHPYSAAVVGLVFCLVAGLADHLRPSPATRRFAYAVWLLLSLQICAGLLNVVLLAPVWMQIVHLALADFLWLGLVLLTAAAMAEGVPHVEMLHVPAAVLSGAKPRVKDYVALTKPRVISLLLFTTLAAMFIAQRGWPTGHFLSGLWLLTATGAGLYAAAGSANAINMVCERDLDVRMERTASRPTVTETIHPRAALWFALGLEGFSFALLWWSSNLLAAVLALAGLVVYVIVYTLLLKRRTWSNIVIGGAAGAFPPLVGWAAVDGRLTPLAWLMFGLIFAWTPVHFWALALLIKDDYAKAGVPMLPVVKGDRYTVVQIGWYALVTIAVSLLPLCLHVHWFYGAVAVALNVVLLRRWWELQKGVSRARASSLFHYSMIYLALLFLAMAIDKSVLA